MPIANVSGYATHSQTFACGKSKSAAKKERIKGVIRSG
jgi:hypothetical protein